MSKKRPREKKDVNVQLVEIYEDLSNEDPEIQLAAAKRLLDRKNLSHEDVLATLNRLIRGLCSGRKASRPGFSVALTEFLTLYSSAETDATSPPQLNPRDALTAIREQTRTGGNISGQEELNHYRGRLFAIAALMKSKVMFRSDAIDIYNQAIDLVFELAREKPSLREECGLTLLQTLQTLQSLPDGATYAQYVIAKLHSEGLAKTLEGVALWTTAQQTFPSLRWPKDVFRHHDPLHRKEQPMLAKVLKGSAFEVTSGSGEGKGSNTGWWTLQLHFAWEVILTSVLQESGKKIRFADLWTEVVDVGLFGRSASEESKSRGFLLIQKLVPNIKISAIPSIFGQNFIRCLVNQLTQKERYLHAAAGRTLKAIVRRAASDREVAVLFTKVVMRSYGYTNFDDLTKTKTFDQLLRDWPLEDMRELLEILKGGMAQTGTDDDKLAFTKRRILADYLLHIIKTLDVPTSEAGLALYRDTVEAVIGVLVTLASSDSSLNLENSTSTALEPSMTHDCREMIWSRTLSCLNHLIAKDPNPAWHTYRAARLLQLHTKRANGSLFKANEQVQSVVDRSWSALERIHAREKSKRSASYDALELLFSMTLIQAYHGEAEAANILDDLQGIYKPLLKGRSNDKEDTESTMLVEILLSLLSRSSSLFRQLAHKVFQSFSPMIGDEGLESMIDILEARESMEGQNQLFEEGADEADIDMEDVNASDVEEIISEPSVSETISESESVSDGVSDVGTGNEANDAEAAEFEKKLAAALGTRRADADAAISESESSDEDMDDEQMEALDPVMTNIFKERSKMKTKKQENKAAKEKVVQLKCRVLELLNTYIKQQFASSAPLYLLHTLLDVIRTTKSKLLCNRACDFIRGYSKLYKIHNGIDEVALARARELLPQVHVKVRLEGSKPYLSACSSASFLLAKVIVSNGGTMEEVRAVYLKTESEYAPDPRCNVGSLFQDWFSWFPTARSNLQKVKQG